MESKTRLIIIFTLIGFLFVGIVTLPFILRPPELKDSSVVTGQENVALEPKIILTYGSNIKEGLTKVEIKDKINSSYKPVVQSSVSKNKLFISFEKNGYLLPNNEYTLTITPYSDFLSLKGRVSDISFKTRALKENEMISTSMTEKLMSEEDAFEEGKTKGFEFISSIPVENDKFTIFEGSLMLNGRVNILVSYSNEGTSEDVITWLKDKGANTEKIDINL
ncbi:MAG: Ig-like domain-containing protein [bacterium]